jgi:hypothetical protein
MDGTGDTIAVVRETARSFECHSNIGLGFTTRNDDGETLFGSDMRTTIAPWHLRGLKLDIGIEPRRLVAFTIIRDMWEAEGRNVSGGYGRGCRRAVLSGLGGGSGDWRCAFRGGPQGR